MIITGIYIIVNKINNKIYIGSSTNISKRWRDHKWYLNHNKHHNSHLQLSWNKYTITAFEFFIVEECKLDDLLTKEKEYILYYNSFDKNFGYNINDPKEIHINKNLNKDTKIPSNQKTGDKNPMYGKKGNLHPKFNYKLSEESKNKISISRKGIFTCEKHPMSKLKSDDIINIRKLFTVENFTQTKIAKIYNVTQATISSIILGKTWLNIK